jgi:prepilin-type N-terminal cleavage/methylation domain-containing protein
MADRTDRAGFTLIEVVLALTILLVVMVSFVSMTGRTVHVAATSDREQGAVQLAADRIEQVRSDPNYAKLDSLYVATESSFPTWPGLVRSTTIVRTTAGLNDYKRVTVTVTGPGLAAPVTRSVTVAAP